MINFLKKYGFKVWEKKRIYLNSVPFNKFPFMISSREYSKAYFDIKDNRFYNLSASYEKSIIERYEAEKDTIEAETKEELPATPSEPVQIPKIKADDETEIIKGSRKLTSLLMEKVEGINKESKRAITKRVKELIDHGRNQFYFNVSKTNKDIEEKIKANKELQKYLIESVVNFFIERLEAEKSIDDFDDLLSFVWCKYFDNMTENVKNYILQACNDNKVILPRSESQKRADKKYNESVKGKQSSKRYRESEKGQATIKNYKQSEQGKEATKKANRKYRESEKGQQTQKQSYNKYSLSEKGKEARLRAVKAYREKQKQLKQVKEM